MKQKIYFALIAIMISSCGDKNLHAGLYCGKNVEETIKYSSAVIYGVEVPPPLIVNSYPLTQEILAQISIPDKKALTLVSINSKGDIFFKICGHDTICSLDDAMSVFDKCKNTEGCQIVGGIKESVFYPVYKSDKNGGHVCAWRTKSDL